jgi:hypothetical protein
MISPLHRLLQSYAAVHDNVVHFVLSPCSFLLAVGPLFWPVVLVPLLHPFCLSYSVIHSIRPESSPILFVLKFLLSFLLSNSFCHSRLADLLDLSSKLLFYHLVQILSQHALHLKAILTLFPTRPIPRPVWRLDIPTHRPTSHFPLTHKKDNSRLEKAAVRDVTAGRSFQTSSTLASLSHFQLFSLSLTPTRPLPLPQGGQPQRLAHESRPPSRHPNREPWFGRRCGRPRPNPQIRTPPPLPRLLRWQLPRPPGQLALLFRSLRNLPRG